MRNAPGNQKKQRQHHRQIFVSMHQTAERASSLLRRKNRGASCQASAKTIPSRGESRIITSEKISEITDSSVARCAEGTMALIFASKRTSRKSSKMAAVRPQSAITQGMGRKESKSASNTMKPDRSATDRNAQFRVRGTSHAPSTPPSPIPNSTGPSSPSGKPALGSRA